MRKVRLLPLVLISLFLFILPFFGTVIFLICDGLWYHSVAYGTVFTTLYFTRIKLGLLVGFIFFAVLLVNVLLAGVLRTRIPYLVGDNLLEMPISKAGQGALSRLFLLGSLVVSLFTGLGASFHWKEWLEFLRGTPFGMTDPLFGKDISFYLFKMPFYQYVYSLAFSLILFSIIAVVAMHVMQKGIYMMRNRPTITKSARAHILTLLGLLFILKTWGYHLSILGLVFSPRGMVFGATYADVNVQAPMLKVMMVAALVMAVILFATAFTRNWRVPLAAFALYLLLSLVLLVGYPEGIHRFVVLPNEIEKEKLFIQRNIEYTSLAFGLANIDRKSFPASGNLTRDDLERNVLTLKNIRLWDREPLLATFRQLQEIRTYYDFIDVDNDRYVVKGEYRQVMLSPRELAYRNLPSKNWINEKITFTHGYGLCMGPVNQVTPEGMPEFFIKDIPPVSTDPKIALAFPQIYFGETPSDYALVHTGVREFDYPSGDSNEYTFFSADTGVSLGNIFRRALFALRFGEPKIFLTWELGPKSRILMYRNIRERVRKLTPGILYDGDPYIVISGGRLYWILDGYTVSSYFPYSQPYGSLGNYIRNSVKAVVDAYSGNVTFYISDPKDPLINTYASIFQGILHPLDEMPEDLRRHIRYPEDLFALQARIYATYHMSDPGVFYNKEDQWQIPRRSGRFDEDGEQREMAPYYTVMKLPGETKEEFILMIPFTPARKQNMIAWLAGRCDAPNYGKLLVFEFPKKKVVYGPSQVEARIDQDTEISRQLSLWNQRGSKVIRGNLLVIPIEDSILYVEPLYLSAESSQGQLPELKRVIISFGNQVVMEQTLEQGLARIFGKVEIPGVTVEPEEPGKAPDDVSSKGTPSEPSKNIDKQTRELIQKAASHLDAARKYQREENWEGYGEEMRKLREVMMRLKER
jgi:uncharacterized membrane protein (UPF0182 family)